MWPNSHKTVTTLFLIFSFIWWPKHAAKCVNIFVKLMKIYSMLINFLYPNIKWDFNYIYKRNSVY